MMNWFKNSMLFRLVVLIRQLKKANYNTKIDKIEKEIPDPDQCIPTQEFNKLTADDFAERLNQVDLASKNNIARFIKKTDFHKIFNKIN